MRLKVFVVRMLGFNRDGKKNKLRPISRIPRQVHSFFYVFMALATIPLITLDHCFASEVVSVNNEIGVLRDLSNIPFADDQIKNARVFFYRSRFVVKGLSKEDNEQLQQIAIRRLGDRLHLVGSLSEANYLVQIRMRLEPDFALRNPLGEASRGHVVISTCKYPVRKIVDDCENLEFDFFRRSEAVERLSTALQMWWTIKQKSQ